MASDSVAARRRLVPFLAVIFAAVCLALGLVACGGSDDSSSSADTGSSSSESGSDSGESTGGDSEEGGGDPIKVAGIFDMTGVNGAFGSIYAHNAELAFEEANEKGGVNGSPIEMKVYDTASDNATATLETRKATTRDGYEIVYGGVLTGPSLATAEVTEETGALYYSPASVAPELTKPTRPLTFAVDPTLEVQATNMVKLMKSMGLKKVGLIQEAGGYGEESADALGPELEKAGIELAESTEIASEPTDATNQVEAMKNAGVEAVALGVTLAPSVAIVKSMAQQGLEVPAIAVGGGLSEATEELVTSSAPVEYYAATPLACPLGIAGCGDEFAKAYEAKFKEKPIVWTAQGYVAAKAFIAALEEAPEITPEAIAETLETKEGFKDPLLPGAVEFTPDQHLGVLQVYLQGWKDGKAYFFGNDINENRWPTK